jgi:ornithine cyclodeaminase
MIGIFEEKSIRAATSPAHAVAAIREAFRADGLGKTIVPPVINLAVAAVDGEFHIKTAYIEGVPHVAVKVASGFYHNPSRGLPSGSGLMALFDAWTGQPSAILLDNGYLTDLRTGAAGAVAAEHLAREDCETVGVIGSGVQARMQVACLSEVRPIRRVVAWSRNAERLARYCAEIGEQIAVEARAMAGIEDVCGAADILVTTTPAQVALVRAGWLRPGMHVTAVGSDSPGKQELDAGCFRRADLAAADRVSQCLSFGELCHAMAAATIERDGIVELGAIVAGKRTGRTRTDQITIADLTGVGFQDTAIASAVHANLVTGSSR